MRSSKKILIYFQKIYKRTENIKVQAKRTPDRNQIQKSMAQNFFFEHFAQKVILSENVYQKIREIDLFSCDEFLGLYLCSKYIYTM